MAEVSYPSGDIQEVVIEAPEADPELLATHTTQSDAVTHQLQLVLSRGTATRTNADRASELVQSGDSRRQVFADANRAIAYYLSILSVNGYTEQAARDSLAAVDALDMAAYEDYRTSLSTKARGRQLIRDSKERMADIGSPLDRVIFDPPSDIAYSASWRDTTPTDDHVEIATRLLDRIDRNPQSCYKTAYRALTAFDGDADRIRYCEGLALGKHPGRAATHAWIELDGQVIELTWPWDGPRPPEQAMYYGAPLDTELVRETHERRPTFSSVLLPDEVYMQYRDVKKALWSSLTRTGASS